MMDLLQEAQLRIKEIDRRAEEEKRQALEAVMGPVRERLAKIAEERRKLDEEEAGLRKSLSLPEIAVKRRRRSSKRMNSSTKKEIVSRFVSEGHIKDGMTLSKELREALKDEGFGPHDFRALNDYLPQGWTSESNGMRGTAARTVFHRS